MVKLRDSEAVMRLDIARQSFKRGAEPLLINPELALEALSARLHISRRGHHRPETALRAHNQPVMLLLRKQAVRVTLLVCQRGQHEAVLHTVAATECERVEQVRHDRWQLPLVACKSSQIALVRTIPARAMETSACRVDQAGSCAKSVSAASRKPRHTWIACTVSGTS